jgi:hypothetical protein
VAPWSDWIQVLIRRKPLSQYGFPWSNCHKTKYIHRCRIRDFRLIIRAIETSNLNLIFLDSEPKTRRQLAQVCVKPSGTKKYRSGKAEGVITSACRTFRELDADRRLLAELEIIRAGPKEVCEGASCRSLPREPSVMVVPTREGSPNGISYLHAVRWKEMGPGASRAVVSQTVCRRNRKRSNVARSPSSPISKLDIASPRAVHLSSNPRPTKVCMSQYSPGRGTLPFRRVGMPYGERAGNGRRP